MGQKLTNQPCFYNTTFRRISRPLFQNFFSFFKGFLSTERRGDWVA